MPIYPAKLPEELVRYADALEIGPAWPPVALKIAEANLASSG